MSTLQPTLAPKQEKTAHEIRRVCFVCTGNTCRSPMAAAVANALAHRKLQDLPESLRSLALPELEAFSAGIYAHEGDPIAENAILALESAEIPVIPHHDYHLHTAHALTEEEAEGYDLLIGLTREHAMTLLMLFPHLARRITVLPTDVADPYGGSLGIYTACLERIIQGVRGILFSEDVSV